MNKEKPDKEIHKKEYEEIEGYGLNEALVVTNKKLNDFINLLQTDHLPKLEKVNDLEKRIADLEEKIG